MKCPSHCILSEAQNRNMYSLVSLTLITCLTVYLQSFSPVKSLFFPLHSLFVTSESLILAQRRRTELSFLEWRVWRCLCRCLNDCNNTYLLRGYFDTMQLSCFSSKFCPLILTSAYLVCSSCYCCVVMVIFCFSHLYI